MMWRVLAIACLANLSIVAALLAPVEGLYASDKYLISYLPYQDWQQSIANNATALGLGNIMELGDNLSCYVPTISAVDGDVVEELNETELEAVLSSNLRNGAELITQSFNDCISYLSGFWNYEFCSHTGLTQFHGNPQTTPLIYTLGRSKKEDREFQLLYNDFGYYISEILGSGDICDVTGRPRVVEVQYICRPAAGPASIQWVREVKTCHYEIQVAMSQLCSVELLSKIDDREVSGSIVCAETQETNDSPGTVGFISYYKPTFIGSELYLLEPNHKNFSQNRTALLYTGESTFSDPESQEDTYEINEQFGNAIGRMFFQHLLLSPDQSPYEAGDKFVWMSEVFDSKGNFLTMVGFNLSSSLAEIILDDSLQFTSPGNFLYYQRPDIERAATSGQLAGKLESVDDKEDYTVFDTQLLDTVSDAKVKEILENLLNSNEFAEVLEDE